MAMFDSYSLFLLQASVPEENV